MDTPATDPRDVELARALANAELLQPGEGFFVDVDEPTYHELTLASRSQLELLVGDEASPSTFHARHVEGTLPFEETRALRLGRWTHCAVLEPERWAAQYTARLPAPEKPDFSEHGHPNTKAHRAAVAKWKEQVAAERAAIIRGRTELDAEDHEAVLSMAEAIALRPDASELVSEARGHRERSMFWRDRVTGVLMRARVDVALERRDAVDLKTTSHPSPIAFGRSVKKYGYHRQAACYLDGLLACTGVEHRWMFVVVRSSPTWEVGVYGLSVANIATGRRQYRAALEDLARRRMTGDWQAHWERQPMELHVPYLED